MFDLDVATLLAAKGGRPISVASLVSAIFLPSSLLVYLTRPDLFIQYGIVGGIFFGTAIGLPLVAACCWPWYSVFAMGLSREKLVKRLQDAALTPAPVEPEPSIVEQITEDDPLEWPTLLLGGWIANAILYVLVVLAYYKRLLLGATLILTVSIVLGVGLLVIFWLGRALGKFQRETEAVIEKLQKARKEQSRQG